MLKIKRKHCIIGFLVLAMLAFIAVNYNKSLSGFASDVTVRVRSGINDKRKSIQTQINTVRAQNARDNFDND
ncbi:hypothetical protein [Fructobacillus ficulneus]|uniref:Glycosyltransferase n=1 Tax=Fructobacillus ficulneus TaxID=157463 RepID=A0A0K8MFG6_9LACO|nr:hypothetical protein [Fructobacillus ficulneus]GAO99232.1 glycosyltransferase [Fructobacillus ficulneus]